MNNKKTDWEEIDEVDLDDHVYEKCLMAIGWHSCKNRCVEMILEMTENLKSTDETETFTLFFALWHYPQQNFNQIENLDENADAYVVQKISTDFLPHIHEQLNQLGFECRIKG